MRLIKTAIDGVVVIEPQVFGDSRGWFIETYSKSKFRELGINDEFVQDNHSHSVQKGTLRGLHFQNEPKAQSKLVRCTKGKILDVALDLRKGSSTFKKWVAIELSEENMKQLYIPKGFAHGFLTLTDDVEVQYKVDEFYSPEHDRTIRFDDPELNVDWKVQNPILSEKDSKAPFLRDSDFNLSVKVMVTGANGQLGSDIVERLRKLKINVIAVTRYDLDITNKGKTKEYIGALSPDIIIHCAAYTAVDKAEEERQLCYAVNVEGTRNVAEAAKLVDATLVYISTDYVFSGLNSDPYLEEDKTNPINYYGFTKEQGEKIVQSLIKKHYIVRTSWVYGKNGNNFVKTMLKLAESRVEISVVDDQIGAPTYTKDVASFICDLIQSPYYGIYHCVNEGYCTWYDFAKAIFENAHIPVKLNPISSSLYASKAKRPLNSKLSKSNTDTAGLNRLPHWRNALWRFMQEYVN